MSNQATSSLKEQVEQKRLAIELAGLTAQEKLLEGAMKPLRETAWGEVVPKDDYPWHDVKEFQQSGSLFNRPYTTVDDRVEGKFLPLYRDEYDLRRMRAKHRAMYHFISVGSGLVQTLIDYTIGTGLTVETLPKEEFAGDATAKQLAVTVQSVIDELLDAVDFHGNRDREILELPVSEGELFWALYPDEYKQRDGFPKLRHIEPDEVTEPAVPFNIEKWLGTLDDFQSFWKFGVHTKYCHELKREDLEEPLGYHIVFDDGGVDWDYIPANRMIHVKRNVGRRAKRGVSDLLATELTMEKAHKLMARTGDGAIAQASIAYIRKWAATSNDIEDLVSSQFGFDVKALKDGTPTDRRAVRLDRTRIVDVPNGAEYEAGPMGQLRQPVFVDVAQFLLRLSAARWSMPEFMISGDASNANYASTLVTEAPFVKARERDQRQVTRSVKELIWKALKLMYDAGRFRKYIADWKLLARLVDISVTAPEVASRDTAAMATANETLYRNRIKSARTWAEEEGLDYDREQANMESEPPPPGDGPENILAGLGAIREANASAGLLTLSEAENCGTGEGGFKNDNTCARGDGNSETQHRDETVFDPDDPPKLDQPITAIRLEDGTILMDKDAKLHIDAINNLGVDMSEVAGGGFINEKGEYTEGSADAAKLGMAARARKAVAARREAAKTRPIGTVRHGRIDVKEAASLDEALEANGGFTYQPVDDYSPTEGFAVSPFPEAEAVYEGDVSAKQIYDYLATHREKFRDPRVNVGAWYDTESKKTYLDLSIVEPSKEKATALAKAHSQEGIYDLRKGETIITKAEEERRK